MDSKPVRTSGSFVEDALRAVAVMHVDIEDRDPLVLQSKLSRRHCAVVKKAEIRPRDRG
jgi:hypothetical protein